MRFLLCLVLFLALDSFAACPSSGIYQKEMLSYVNSFRAQGGTCGTTRYPAVGRLSLHRQLHTAALGHAKDMAAQNYFNHVGLDGRKPTDRIRATGYLTGAKRWSTGENIGAGTIRSAAKLQFEAWKKSAGHCASMMAAKFQHMGIACAHTTTSRYKHYWVMNLGRNRS